MPPWGFLCNGLDGARTASSWLEVHFDPALVVDGCCYCLSLCCHFVCCYNVLQLFISLPLVFGQASLSFVILFVVTMYRSFFKSLCLWFSMLGQASFRCHFVCCYNVLQLFYLFASGFRCLDRRHFSTKGR